jgi:isoquinoline 1-oxidoreductase subunit alpha
MVTLEINGKSHTVDASPDMPLLWVLRDLLGMNGTKFGCGVALCGACTVHLDGIPRRSCVMPVSATAGHSITTIEGVGATATGKRVQQAWLDLEVIQPAAGGGGPLPLPDWHRALLRLASDCVAH